MIKRVTSKEKKDRKQVEVGTASAAGGRSAPIEYSAAGEPRIFVVP